MQKLRGVLILGLAALLAGLCGCAAWADEVPERSRVGIHGATYSKYPEPPDVHRAGGRRR